MVSVDGPQVRKNQERPHRPPLPPLRNRDGDHEKRRGQGIRHFARNRPRLRIRVLPLRPLGGVRWKILRRTRMDTSRARTRVLTLNGRIEPFHLRFVRIFPSGGELGILQETPGEPDRNPEIRSVVEGGPSERGGVRLSLRTIRLTAPSERIAVPRHDAVLSRRHVFRRKSLQRKGGVRVARSCRRVFRILRKQVRFRALDRVYVGIQMA